MTKISIKKALLKKYFFELTKYPKNYFKFTFKKKKNLINIWRLFILIADQVLHPFLPYSPSILFLTPPIFLCRSQTARRVENG